MRPRSIRAGLTDLAVVFVLLALGVLGFGPVFGGTDYLMAGLGGAVLGLAIAFAGARLRWGIIRVAFATVLGYLLCGGALALGATTVLGVVPTLVTLRELALGVVVSWKELLTAPAPVAGFDTLLVVPFLATLLAAVIAGSLVLGRRPAFALLPVLVLFALAIAFGTRDAVFPVERGVALAVGGLGWAVWRLAADRAARVRATRVGSPGASAIAGGRRLLWGAVLLAVALVAGVGVGHAEDPAVARQVLRDAIVPPLDLRHYPSPLVSFRKYVRDFTEKPLLTVSGLPDGARVRLATLDQYDGVVYNVSGDGSAGSGTFARVGSAIADTHEGQQATLHVTIHGLAGAWVPTLGYATSFAFEGDRRTRLSESLHYNGRTGAALSTLGLQEGDSYTVTALLPPTPTDAQLSTRKGAALSMPVSVGVPNAVASAAEAAIGDAATPIAEVRAIESTLQEDGFLSHGLEGETSSRSGHGADRIGALLGAGQMVGDDEQYAVAMALEVAHLGLPARVVMGLYPRKTDASAVAGSVTAGAVQLHSEDLHAWVEVAFDGYGWVSFDPTPPEDRIPQTEQPQPKSEPQAQVLQPPLPVQAPVDLPPAVLPQEALDESPVNIWATVLLVAGTTGGILLLILLVFGPPILVGALKARRRRRRFGAERPSDRLSGGWSEITDTAADLGVRLVPGATRSEGSAVLARHYPDAGITLLAARVDAGVFGPTEATDAELLTFWSDVDHLTAVMTQSVGPWARLRARLSLRSLTHWTRRSRARPPRTRSPRSSPNFLTPEWRRTP